MTNMPPSILLVEDNPDDVFFMQRALRKSGLEVHLHLAKDGQEAVDYLAGQGLFADRSQHPLPHLVFLDLKLPYLGGFEVLEWMRQQPELQGIPVTILTSSDEERDRQRATTMGVSSYLVKPPTSEMLRAACAHLCSDSLAT